MTTPSPDKELREAIIVAAAQTIENFCKCGWRDAADTLRDSPWKFEPIEALLATTQQQLLSELIGKADTYCTHYIMMRDMQKIPTKVEAVPLSVLQHKLDEITKKEVL